jgi:uncharacterized glyoxalase superfamily protein PhnB
MKSHFIFYVFDQDRATAFYSKVLNQQPDLNVPGMTEFMLSATSVLGLMPQAGIVRLLGSALPKSTASSRDSRAELYLIVSDVDEVHSRALAAGAIELSPPQLRDWGHRVGYSLDLDGHVLAVARVEH